VKPFWKTKSKPSEEARRARESAGKASESADAIYGERRKILDENHFAERIRLIYEGR
jgi:hypothetical protein